MSNPSSSYQLLLDALKRAETNHFTDEEEQVNIKIRSLGYKIIDLCQSEMIKDKTLTQNEILLSLAGLLSSGIIINQKDQQSGIYYATKICERILGHVMKENTR